jgi:aryl-alcohol dehydrogenase-like predicted oxidoreductase
MTLRPEPYGKFLTKQTFNSLEALRARATERDMDMATLALAWIMAHPLVTAPIIGPRRPEQLEPARKALEITLTEGERKSITDLFSV